VKPGEPVEKGEAILELHTDDPERMARAREALEGAIDVSDDVPAGPSPLVLGCIG
jgi:thymidine phosphorylase